MHFSRNVLDPENANIRKIATISRNLKEMPKSNLPPKRMRNCEAGEEEHREIKSPANEIFKEFCSESTVHGVRYFTEAKRHWLERLWWSLAILLSIVACVYSIQSIWMKWTRNPVTMTFDDKTTSVEMIPFPAVSVCTTEKFNREKVDVHKFNEIIQAMYGNHSAYLSLSSEQITRFNAFLQVCTTLATFDKNAVIPTSLSICNTIKDITPDQNSIIQMAMWSDKNKKSSFKPLFTEDGLCLIFNSLNSRELYSDEANEELFTFDGNPDGKSWNIEDGYQSNIEDHNNPLYPYRTFGTGMPDALRMFLGLVLDDTHQLCSPYAAGFHISLHAPDNLPRMLRDYIQIPLAQDVYISIKPNVITTSKDLRTYKPLERGCYFKAERPFRFFRSYSQQKCEMECVSNHTVSRCACAQYSMPRGNETRVCTMLDLVCYYESIDEFAKQLFVRNCSCLPDCSSISYELEISQGQADYIDNTKSEKVLNGSGYKLHSKVFISFKENNFLSLNRLATSTMPDFISSCGGLLGLFMGISVLSIVELVYYFTLRLCCNLKKSETHPTSPTAWVTRNQSQMGLSRQKEWR